jgi:hypothetical protein
MLQQHPPAQQEASVSTISSGLASSGLQTSIGTGHGSSAFPTGGGAFDSRKITDFWSAEEGRRPYIPGAFISFAETKYLQEMYVPAVLSATVVWCWSV